MPVKPRTILVRGSGCTHRICRRLPALGSVPSAFRAIHTTSLQFDTPSWPPGPIPQPPIGPSSDLSVVASSSSHHGSSRSFFRDWASSASFQAALTTIIGLGMVFVAGVGYLEWYKAHVLHRVSFHLFLHALARSPTDW